MNAESIKTAALSLPLDEQVKLTKRLLLNLESSQMLYLLLGGNKSEDEYWKAEALKRANAIDNGKSIPIDGNTVKKELSELLRNDRV